MKTKKNRRSTADEAKTRNETDELIHISFAKGDRTFRVCCLKAKVEPGKRQAGKFKQGKGAAFAQLAHLTAEDME